MSKSLEKFNVSIQDSKNLLDMFDKQSKLNPENAEVLKRAGLVMAFTAWELKMLRKAGNGVIMSQPNRENN